MKGFFYSKSEYSMLNSSLFISDLVNKSKEYGYKFIALTDDALFGAYKFIQECEKAEIKPIIGLEARINNELLLIYALNNNGYKLLLKLSTDIKNEVDVDFDYFKDYKNDVICITPGIDGEFEKAFSNGDMELANNIIRKYTKIFSHFYIGLQKQKFPFDLFYEDIKAYAIKCNIKYLPIHETLFLNKEDVKVYKAIRKIAGIDIDSSYYIEDYLKTIEELDSEFMDDDVYKYVNDVYDLVNIKINKITKPLITYPSNKDVSSKDYLMELCYLGLKKRLNGVFNKEYENRLLHELSIISKMGYDDYFLIVFDFVKYAKKNGILIGPGRGSAAGSLVSYLLGITNIDPIEYDLLFERFLNPYRVTMPDIDIDIPSDRRMDVIDYLINKYGSTNVCLISTFDTFKGKSSINDVSKALGLKDYESSEIAYKCQFRDSEGKTKVTKESIINAYNMEDNLKYKEVLYICSKIFDLPKSLSTHASGVILSNDPLLDNVPLITSNNYSQSQFDAHDLEDLGLLKMDLLSLKNLTMLDKTIKEAKVNIKEIPLDDTKTYELLSSAKTNGIFQLEGKGIRRVLKKFKPTTFNDLVAIIALYRPGPMNEIDEFIARKNGKAFNYPNDKLIDILKPTYGIIVYQEQIMRIAQMYANFNLADADMLRRAISKKDSRVLEEYREKFVSNSKNKDEANSIYDYIVKFGDYGFNKSHSVSYALLLYQMSYIKANYPKEFITSFLNDSISDISGSLEYFMELRSNGINVTSPNINISTNKYEINNNEIYLPLSLVKTISNDDIIKIIEERKNGLFSSFTDFMDRVKLDSEKYINLINANVFSGIKKDLIRFVDSKNTHINEDLITGVEYTFDELLENEKKALGFNLEYTITKKYNDDFIKYSCVNFFDIIQPGEYNVIANIIHIKEIETKKKEKMGFVELFDSKMIIEATLFTKEYERITKEFNKNNKIKYNDDVFRLKLRANIRDSELQFELIDAFKY